MAEQHMFYTPFEIEEKTNGDFYVSGLISTTHPDLVQDIVSESCLKSMLRQMMERSIKADLEHEAVTGETREDMELNKTKIPIARFVGGEVVTLEKGHKGLLVKSLLNKYHSQFSEYKGSIKEGFLDSFSIAYIPTKTKITKLEEKEYRVLDDVVLLNVAFTGNPANTHATFTDIAVKSINYLEAEEVKKKFSQIKELNPDARLEVKSLARRIFSTQEEAKKAEDHLIANGIHAVRAYEDEGRSLCVSSADADEAGKILDGIGMVGVKGFTTENESHSSIKEDTKKECERGSTKMTENSEEQNAPQESSAEQSGSESNESQDGSEGQASNEGADDSEVKGLTKEIGEVKSVVSELQKQLAETKSQNSELLKAVESLTEARNKAQSKAIAEQKDHSEKLTVSGVSSALDIIRKTWQK